MITRYLEKECLSGLKKNPVAAILGPRQCGKTTLAKKILNNFKEYIYLDLERPSDLAKLENPEWYFLKQKGKLICLDEIQRKPDLFPLIRSIVDENGAHAQFLILGSSSPELLRQSSESLAGRITFKTLTPFLFNEISNSYSMESYFERGGFPRSILAATRKDSMQWREDFIAAYLERDIHQWMGVSPVTIRRVLKMMTHYNGQTVNYSALGNSLGISNVTLKNYIDLLSGTFMADVVQPWQTNVRKRLIKAPKIYIRDTGIAAALIGLNSFDDMAGHLSFGALWESLILSNLRGYFPKAEICFYRTSHGAELDFVINQNNKTVAVECKTNINPTLSKGNYISIGDIAPNKTFIIAPVKESWEHSKNIFIAPLPVALKRIKDILN